MPRSRPVPLLFAALALGCGSEGDEGRTLVTTVDTVAGVVRIGHAGSPPRWRAEPLLTLGEVGGLTGEPSPEEFGRIESVIADAEGRVFVADGLALEVRVFAPDGAFLRRLGRKGGGPGEMEGLHGVAWLAGDTLVVMDPGNARLMRLTARGEYAGQWPWARLTGPDRFLFDGGERELYARAFRTGTADRELRAVWVRYTPEGARDSLDIPRAEPKPGSSAVCRGEGIGFFSNPFADRLLAAPAPAGERVVAWASAYRLAFLAPSGDTLRIVSRDVEPAPLPDSAWAPVEQELLEFRRRWSGADCEGDILRPEHRPVLRDVHFDHDGRMLVEHATAAGDAFDLFDPGGRLLASFPAPPDRDRSVPPFLRGDRLYLVTRDSLDVQRVRAWRIGPEGGR